MGSNKDKILLKFKSTRSALAERRCKVEKSDLKTNIDPVIVDSSLDVLDVYAYFKVKIKAIKSELKLIPTICESREQSRPLILGQTLLDCSNDSKFFTLKDIFQKVGSCQMTLHELGFKSRRESINTFLNVSLDVYDNILLPIVKEKSRMTELYAIFNERKNTMIKLKKTAENGNFTTSISFLEKAKISLAAYYDSKNAYERSKETLSILLLEYILKLSDICNSYLTVVEELYKYHLTCKHYLEAQISSLEISMEKYSLYPIYGISLEEHFAFFGVEISMVLSNCLTFLYKNGGFETEGVFRKVSKADKVKQLKSLFDSGIYDLTSYIDDIHTVTGSLKLYLSELPEPLFILSMGESWNSVSKIKDKDTRFEKISRNLKRLPALHYTNLAYICYFLHYLTYKSEVTRMTANSLSICIAPNLLITDDEAKALAYTHAATVVLTNLIENYHFFFFDQVLDIIDVSQFNVKEQTDDRIRQRTKLVNKSPSPSERKKDK